ncbi:GNAT family N-acetyltransferase [Ignavibacteriales bacterium]
MSYTIRKIIPKEIKLFMDWAEKEGWNPGLNDGRAFLFTDPAGFLVGELDGEIIAIKSAIRYGNEFGFMGFYIVKPEYRGKGYGYKLWWEGFNRVMNIPSGMDGVPEQQENYIKSGYDFAYRQIRFEGKDIIPKESFNVKPVVEADLCNILDYDKTIFPASRAAFIKEWVMMPESLTLKIDEGVTIKGYGTIRKCVNGGFKIGPLFADNEVYAKQLFLSLIDFADGNPVYIDTPEINHHAVELAKAYGMKPVFETARMYHGGNPERRREKIYGVTSFELG